MSDKKVDSIADQLREIIERPIEQSEAPEDLEVFRQIERANEKLKQSPKRDWLH